jgi:hypothetical protein
MSALGQKQTYALQQLMSALHPIATAKAKFRKRPCLLYPQKRTCAVHLPMSAMGQKRTSDNCRVKVALGKSDIHHPERPVLGQVLYVT